MPKNRTQYWLALKFVPRLATHKKITLVNEHGLQALFTSSIVSINKLTQKQQVAFKHPDWQKIDNIIAASEYCKSEIILFDDEDYPQLLKQIYDPPLILFIQGNKKLLNHSQIAIVGSRSASITGRDIAYQIANQLSDNGVAVTSGLALGIDAAAHKGALASSLGTIAVVATGLDQVYPARHRQLAKNILNANGAIISEFLPGTSPKPGHFPKRNRVISGLSLGVVVVEAAIKSGSLITARFALEHNREVFAIPGALSNPLTKGCHSLIKQGAKLVEECADILEELDRPIYLKEKIDKNEKSVQEDLFLDPLLASVGYEITPIDRVISRSKLPVEAVLTRLTMLELKGVIAAVPGGYLRLNRG